MIQMLNSFWGYLHLPPPPPEREVEALQLSSQEPVEEAPEHVELFEEVAVEPQLEEEENMEDEEMVEFLEQLEEIVASNSDDDDADNSG